ncbi:tyrosine-type recombinase/integrase [Tateyamaria sp. syn59]|uniref:tyrosine-type recombinase/integrase n=1 Tax=Tateyamaria sp. syn59 TaxID=2576942 RepID=UPI001CB8C589|nr:tyrosine-type recombinase/integrase [Tateyamaria sp. syn59]
MPHNDLPEGVHRVRRKTKNVDKFHFYAWRGGPKFWESQVRSPRDPEFSVAFSTAVKPRLAGEYMTPQMVDDFLDSTAMPQGARTQADYRKWALRFASEFADDQAKMWEHPKSRGELNEWRAKWKSSPKQHDYAGTVAVRILNWARDEGKIATHFCDRLHRIYSVDRAEIVWTEADQQAFKDAAPSWVKRVMTLACETGLRPADLVRLTRGNLESFDGIDRFRVRTQKRGRVAHIPVTPELRRLIDETPTDQLVLLVNDRNKPLRPTSASRAITRYRDRIADKLSDPTLRLQDTRGTAATRLLRAGLGLNQIANHMGWSLRYAAAVIEHYAAVSPAESAEVLDLLEREKQRREGKTVNAIVNAPDGAKRGES